MAKGDAAQMITILRALVAKWKAERKEKKK
jgi:hypothetical protein